MSNTRKPKTNAAKNDIAKPEPTRTAPLKSVAAKSASAAPVVTKPAPVQPAILSAPAAPVSLAKPTTAPSPAATSPAAPKPVTAAPKPVTAAPKPAPAPAESPKVGHVSLELVKPGAKYVCVAGSFNEWKPEKTPLVQIGNGRWVGDLAINPGKHEYLFVVDGQWLPDPNAKESVQNPFGGRNSILTVSA